jgi:hypothetical protein
MSRRFYSIFATISLLLCLAATIFWVRGYWITDDVYLIYRGEGSERLSSTRGLFFFRHTWPDRGTRGGLRRLSFQATRTASMLPRPSQKLWWIFRSDAVPPANAGFLLPLTAQQSLAMQKAARIRLAQAEKELRETGGLQPTVSTESPTTRNANPVAAAQVRKIEQLQINVERAQAALRQQVAVNLLMNSMNAPFSLRAPSFWEIGFPAWFVVAITLPAWPLLWLVRVLRIRHRDRRGLCRECGYDLRASTERCPECGTATVRGGEGGAGVAGT